MRIQLKSSQSGLPREIIKRLVRSVAILTPIAGIAVFAAFTAPGVFTAVVTTYKAIIHLPEVQIVGLFGLVSLLFGVSSERFSAIEVSADALILDRETFALRIEAPAIAAIRINPWPEMTIVVKKELGFRRINVEFNDMIEQQKVVNAIEESLPKFRIIVVSLWKMIAFTCVAVSLGTIIILG